MLNDKMKWTKSYIVQNSTSAKDKMTFLVWRLAAAQTNDLLTLDFCRNIRYRIFEIIPPTRQDVMTNYEYETIISVRKQA